MTSSKNSNEFNDYYLHYEMPHTNSKIGVIKAVSSKLLDELIDMPYIRISPGLGSGLHSGNESFSNWVVVYDDMSSKMKLVRKGNESGRICSFKAIPRSAKSPQIVVTKKEEKFIVTAPGIRYVTDDMKLEFYITQLDDAHIVYDQFYCNSSEALGKGIIFEVTAIPKRFSVFTRWVYDRYKLVIDK